MGPLSLTDTLRIAGTSTLAYYGHKEENILLWIRPRMPKLIRKLNEYFDGVRIQPILLAKIV
jgi:hypothetical protein